MDFPNKKQTLKVWWGTNNGCELDNILEGQSYHFFLSKIILIQVLFVLCLHVWNGEYVHVYGLAPFTSIVQCLTVTMILAFWKKVYISWHFFPKCVPMEMMRCPNLDELVPLVNMINRSATGDVL